MVPVSGDNGSSGIVPVISVTVVDIVVLRQSFRGCGLVAMWKWYLVLGKPVGKKVYEEWGGETDLLNSSFLALSCSSRSRVASLISLLRSSVSKVCGLE